MRILIATDAWRPQINGVVRSYEHLLERFPLFNAEGLVLSPNMFRHFPCPTYPEIPLALVRQSEIARFMDKEQPNHIHIATEGPIGYQARRWCLANNYPFTTSYHTRFPEYIAARLFVPLSWSYAYQRRFHNAGNGMMVATRSLRDDLRQKGFKNLMHWTRGVNTDLFRPRPGVRHFGEDGPVMLYVGRVAIEKNLKAFLELEQPGRKVVVGDGPQLQELKAAFPDVLFTGPKIGEELAEAYASADVFVFPSRTDTFGIVLLEAIASGVPVAAYPVTGPIDVLKNGIDGVLHEDLGVAIDEALKLDPEACRASALEQNWEKSTEMFLENARSVHLSPVETVT